MDNCVKGQDETDGLIIGGNLEYDLDKNEKNLNVYIQDPKLDEAHARIFCRRYPRGNMFIVKDISDPSFKYSGVQVQLPQAEIDLYALDYIDRKFSILNGRYLFEVNEVPDTEIDTLKVWCIQNKILYARKVF